MLSWPKSEIEASWARDFLLARKAPEVGPGAHFLFWTRAQAPVWVIAFYMWSGKTCHMAGASSGARFFPRSFARTIFHYAFNVMGVEFLFAGGNSTNPASLRMQQYLGFRELWRGDKLHDDSGDMILTGMRKSECPWLKKETENVILVP